MEKARNGEARGLRAGLPLKRIFMLRERNIDIGFIDRRLPGFDGREVQNWASTSRQRSMFVLVSDRLVPKWSEIATLINAYEVMLKPFNESHVENLLKVFWRLNRSADVL